MAKKRVSRKSNGASTEQQMQKPAELSRQSSVEDHDSSEENFHNLKSLNAILLKQTMEKRQQIESLFQAKDALEAELAFFGAEKTRLQEELCGSNDESFKLKLEMDLFMGFVENLVKEMSVGIDGLVKEKYGRECEIRDLKSEANDLMGKLESERKELSRVCDEMNSVKSGFDLQHQEINRLKENVVQMEMKQTSLVEEVGKLKSENDRMVKETKNKEELTKRERTNMEKTLEKKISEIDELKREIKGLVREKIEIEMDKRDQKEKIVELEKKLENMNETLRDQVIELEKNLEEVMEKAKARKEHINALTKEKFIKESEFEVLLAENNSIKKQMEMALLQFSDKEKLVDQLLREKNELVERIVNQEAEFVELQKDYNDQTKTSENLKDALALIEVERDNAGKALDVEKRQQVTLKGKVEESEKIIEATYKELEKIKVERGILVKEKKELENRSESLRKEKGILQKDIVELKRDISVKKTEIESAGTGLTMLKSVSSLVCGSENRKGEQKGMDSYSVELEAIKKAFKSKESIVEEMKKEVEIMKHSVKDAHKKKSFWSIVSSVTTLFLVASAAYAALNK